MTTELCPMSPKCRNYALTKEFSTWNSHWCSHSHVTLLIAPQNDTYEVDKKCCCHKTFIRKNVCGAGRKELQFRWLFVVCEMHTECNTKKCKERVLWGAVCEQVLVIIMRGQKHNVKYATSKTEAEWKRMESAERESKTREMKMGAKQT